MADKDINIHIKAKDTDQSKRDIDGVANSTERVGDKTEQAGRKAKAGTGKMANGLALAKTALSALVGPLGIAAIGAGFVAAGKKVIKFYDDLKAKNDEAVRHVQELRGAYEGLFEALGAFDEESRKQAVLDTTRMLADERVTKDVGLPIIESYTRQFKDSMSPEEFDAGLRGMLGYGARHGGAATPDLIQMMKGWGMTSPERQGEFRRMVAEGAGKSGLTDEDLINALSRGMPTIKAMGWTPEQAIANAATIAQGESGRVKKSLPSTTFQALSDPQDKIAVDDYGFSQGTVEDPRLLFEEVKRRSLQMDQKSAYRMIQNIYGAGGAAGIYKLIAADKTSINQTLERSRGVSGFAAEMEEERLRRETLEARDAGAKAIVEEIAQDVTMDEQYQEDIREIGEESQKRLRRREPVKQWVREFLTPGEEAEKEDAAKRAWIDSLSEEELEQIRKTHKDRIESDYDWGTDPAHLMWERMTPRQRYEGLTGGGPVTNNYNYNYDMSVRYYRGRGKASTRTGYLV